MLQGGAPDYNLFVYRDTSDKWPPVMSSTYGGNELLFSLNTMLFENVTEEGATPFEVEIDKTKMNLSGINVLELRPDFVEYNRIPALLVPQKAGSAYSAASYLQEVLVYDPMLIVIFED